MRKLSTQIRKDQIIHAVLHVIARGGMKQLSVARVSREVGLVPSAIYRHFRSKDKMLDAVLDYIEGRVLNNIHEVCEETEDAVERLHRILLRQLSFIKESPAIPRVLFAQEVFSEHTPRRRKVHKIFTQFRHQVSSIVKIGQKEGRIRSDAQPETIALLLVGIYQPAALLWHLSSGQYDPAAHGKKSWKLFKDMIRPQEK